MIATLVLGLKQISQAQESSTSIGVRVAAGGLFSAKHFLNHEYALEGIFSARWNGVGLHALIQKYQSIEDQANLYGYYGGGLHLGLHGRNNVINPADETNKGVFLNLGIDIVGGIEYRLDSAPIVFSLDYMPSFYFTGNRWLVPENIGLSLRYVL